mgnify:FL=1
MYYSKYKVSHISLEEARLRLSLLNDILVREDIWLRLTKLRARVWFKTTDSQTAVGARSRPTEIWLWLELRLLLGLELYWLLLRLELWLWSELWLLLRLELRLLLRLELRWLLLWLELWLLLWLELQWLLLRLELRLLLRLELRLLLRVELWLWCRTNIDQLLRSHLRLNLRLHLRVQLRLHLRLQLRLCWSHVDWARIDLIRSLWLSEWIWIDPRHSRSLDEIRWHSRNLEKEKFNTSTINKFLTLCGYPTICLVPIIGGGALNPPPN